MRQTLWVTCRLLTVVVVAALFLIALAASTAMSAPASAPASAPPSPRERSLMDFNWRFTNGDPPDVGSSLDYQEAGRLDKTTPDEAAAEKARAATRPSPVETNLGGQISYVQPGFDDANWRRLDLPHDWAVELDFSQAPHVNTDNKAAPRYQQSHGFRDIDASKGTNIGWYRRSFDLPSSDAGKTLSIDFDGVYRNSLVWLNGHCLGRYPSGYSSFSYDITKYAKPGERNTLVVRVDASKWEGWFYEGAGIYRHLWLVKTDPLHVAKWGTFVTSEVNGDDATVTIQTQVRNDGTSDARAQLVSTILDADGKTIAESSDEALTLKAGEEQTATHKVSLHQAKLWSPDAPNLYRVVSTLKKADAVADAYETTFGVRTLRWDANEAFFLNGKHLVIKGTCNHQDHAGVGSALPDRINEWRIERLKEMGSNAYRTSHNPPTPELLDACDRLGMLVLDETRRMDSSDYALEQLESMIRRDRNHPSVFLWSLGNEESAIQGTDVGARIIRTMQDLVHRLDPTRLCTAAMNNRWGTGITTVIDVQGYNYLKQGKMDEVHAKFPALPSLGTEEASTLMTRGEYANTKNGFQAAYDQNVPRWGSTAQAWMQYYAARPFVAGAFVWTGFDYRGEPNPFGWPNTGSQFGIMDTCGFPKDVYWFYQAWWGDRPVLHVFPHWNWQGKEGEPIDVWAYSNCDEVELSLNGTSFGRQKMAPMSHVAWQVKYEPGTLVARGFKDGKEIVSDKVETTGEAVAVKLTADRATIHADGEDVAMVTVSVVDDAGRVVPVAGNEIAFACKGGRIIGVGNGDPTSHEADKADHRKVFNGLAEVIVQATKSPGPIELTASGEGLKAETMTINAEPTKPRPVVP
jgi:beta-galactosidase